MGNRRAASRRKAAHGQPVFAAMIADGRWRLMAANRVGGSGTADAGPFTRRPCAPPVPRYAGAMDEPRDDDDAELFRAAIGPVRRLEGHAPPPRKQPPKPRARMAERDEADARDAFRLALEDSLLEAGDALAYRRESLPPRAWRRLRHGEIAAQDELDLHGADARRAERLLREFMSAAHHDGLGCVRIVHGKGLHGSELFGATGAPVLKNLVDRLLRQRSDVLGFHSAPPAQGGTGAVLVLLAPPKRR